MKLKGVFAIISITSILVGGILHGFELHYGKVFVFLGVAILLFIYIPLFLIGLSRNK